MLRPGNWAPDGTYNAKRRRNVVAAGLPIIASEAVSLEPLWFGPIDLYRKGPVGSAVTGTWNKNAVRTSYVAAHYSDDGTRIEHYATPILSTGRLRISRSPE